MAKRKRTKEQTMFESGAPEGQAVYWVLSHIDVCIIADTVIHDFYIKILHTYVCITKFLRTHELFC
jgi:hypothetical protein